MPVRPNFQVLLRRFQYQVNKSPRRSSCWKWRGVFVNAPKPVSGKSMRLKRATICELQRKQPIFYQNEQPLENQWRCFKIKYLWETYRNTPTNCFWRLKNGLQRCGGLESNTLMNLYPHDHPIIPWKKLISNKNIWRFTNWSLSQ